MSSVKNAGLEKRGALQARFAALFVFFTRSTKLHGALEYTQLDLDMQDRCPFKEPERRY